MKPAYSIQEELKQIAPFLASLPKSHPFSVPENYFDGLETTLISLTREQNVTGESALPGSKDHPFNVPDNYFREFPSSILLKIKSEKRKTDEIKPMIPFTRQLYHDKFWLAAASITLILVVSLFFFTRHQPGGIAKHGLPGSTKESISSDLSYAADIDENLVVDLYIQDQNWQRDQESSSSPQNVSNENNYLRDAADIDPYLINEL